MLFLLRGLNENASFKVMWSSQCLPISYNGPSQYILQCHPSYCLSNSVVHSGARGCKREHKLRNPVTIDLILMCWGTFWLSLTSSNQNLEKATCLRFLMLENYLSSFLGYLSRLRSLPLISLPKTFQGAWKMGDFQSVLLSRTIFFIFQRNHCFQVWNKFPELQPCAS